MEYIRDHVSSFFPSVSLKLEMIGAKLQSPAHARIISSQLCNVVIATFLFSFLRNRTSEILFAQLGVQLMHSSFKQVPSYDDLVIKLKKPLSVQIGLPLALTPNVSGKNVTEPVGVYGVCMCLYMCMHICICMHMYILPV